LLERQYPTAGLFRNVAEQASERHREGNLGFRWSAGWQWVT